MRRRTSRVAAALLSAMALAACSLSDPEEEQAPVPSTNAPTPSIARPLKGQEIRLTGGVESEGRRPVELQRFKSDAWGPYAKGTTKADGTYSFVAETTAPERRFRAHAPAVKKSGDQPALEKFTSEVLVLTTGKAPAPKKLGAHVLNIKTADGEDPSDTTDREGTVSVDGSKPVKLEWIKLRGSSTSRLAKKPYKLKFDKNIDLFGLGKSDPEVADTRWNLLASFQDPSLIRDKVGLDLGRRLSGLPWSPRSTFTEVIINGDYVGSYLVAESIKIDDARIDISKSNGLILEVDGYKTPTSKFGFKSDQGRTPITFKDPDKIDDDVPSLGYTPVKLTALKNQVAKVEAALYGPPAVRDNPRTGWKKYIDLDSAVDYYLVKEFTKDNDADFYRSHFFSWSDYEDPAKKFVFGPAWDFDRGAGVSTDPEPDQKSLASPKGWWMRGDSGDHYNHDRHWYVQMTSDPAFDRALRTRWAEKKDVFKAVFTTWVDSYSKQLAVQGANDERRWEGFERRYERRADTNQGEIDWVARWYEKRYEWMDKQLS